MEDVKVLLAAIKNGDEDAFRTLLKIHHRMIYKIIYSFNLDNGDYSIDPDDLYQEGSIALYDAVFSYEDNRNTRFSSYAYMKIRYHIAGAIRQYRKRYSDRFSDYSLDLHDDHLSLTGIADNALIYHRESSFKEEFDHFVSSLSETDKQIILMRADSYSYKEIASAMNIKTKRVDNRLRQLRKRMKKEFGSVISRSD